MVEIEKLLKIVTPYQEKFEEVDVASKLESARNEIKRQVIKPLKKAEIAVEKVLPVKLVSPTKKEKDTTQQVTTNDLEFEKGKATEQSVKETLTRKVQGPTRAEMERHTKSEQEDPIDCIQPRPKEPESVKKLRESLGY